VKLPPAPKKTSLKPIIVSQTRADLLGAFEMTFVAILPALFY
jgi:hypothetical protein